MKKRVYFLTTVIFGLASLGCSDDDGNNGIKTTISDKQKVVERLKSIETGDMASNAYMNPDKYIQHNLMIADGHSGFEEVMANLTPGSAKVNTVRVFQDGDYVWAHTDYDFFGSQIGIDIFRFEKGLIVEHWDNLQITPSANNPSGHSMVDGAVAVTDWFNTGENKALASQFVEDILMRQNPGMLTNYFNGDNYIQHNKDIADGVQAFREAFVNMDKVYDRIHKVLGEGNFVLVISEGTLDGVPTSYYDMFRIANGKIAEHWDVIETILPPSEWMNQNGKFNFPY